MQGLIADALVSVLGEPTLVNDGQSAEIRFNCPDVFCLRRKGTPDVKFHLYLNRDKRMWLCHRCSAKGTLDWLCKSLGITMRPSVSSWGVIWDMLRKLGDPRPVDEQEDFKPEVIGYPPSMAITKDSDAARYLIERGFGPSHAKRYGLRIGDGEVRKRIVIPTFNEVREVVYWVARDYYGRPNVPKYKNPLGVHKKHFVFNAHQARQSGDEVRICEGTLSAIAAGPQAVALFGKYLSKQQEDLLVRLGFARYVVSLDGDALSSSMQVADRLLRRGCLVSVVRFPVGEDPASLTKDEREACYGRALPYTAKTAFATKMRLLVAK